MTKSFVFIFCKVDERISTFYHKSDESSTLDRHDRSVEASQEDLEEMELDLQEPMQKMKDEDQISNSSRS
jgi:hypothetical protein